MSCSGAERIRPALARRPDGRAREAVVRDNVEPEEEIAAERAVLDRALEVDVGGRDQAKRCLDWLGAAHTFDLVFLNGTEQLRLKVETQVLNLVEKQ